MAVPRNVYSRAGEIDGIFRFDMDGLEEFGPFAQERDDVLTTLASRITQRSPSSLARELRELPDRTGQDMLTVAV